MSVANTTLRVTELDYITIRNNLKAFLRGQDEFTDYDFEGSGMAVLLDVLAYNTFYNAYYLNMVANEAHLDTAQLRQSIISQAKNLGYIPRSTQGAQVKANVTVTPSNAEDNNTNTLTLDRYTRFLAQDIEGVNYQFVTVNSNTATKTDGSFTFTDVVLKQGEVITRQFLMDSSNTKRRFTIPSKTVDTTSLVVTIQDSASNTSTETYTLSSDITEVTGESQVYFLEENGDGEYTITFGDGIIGKKPSIGNIIQVTYLDTVGSVSNNISQFYLSDSIGGTFNDNVSIFVANSSYGGADKESIEDVRFRAPRYYTTQNRAVTTDDYETLILKDYPNVEAVSVWGGEDNDPVIYGKVFMSLKTRDDYKLTELEKERIERELIATRNIVTVTPEIVDPDYVYLCFSGSVYYNPSLTSLTANQLKEYVKASIQDYADNELQGFSSTFRLSKLLSYVDTAEKSITGSDLEVYLQKRIEIDTTKKKSYQVKFNTNLHRANYSTAMFTKPEIYINDYNGVTRSVFFEEVPQSATGIDSITVTYAGTNYFSEPTIVIEGDGTGATARAYVKNGIITGVEILTPGKNYTRATVTAVSEDGSGAELVARLDSRNGTMRSYYFNSSGQKVIINDSAGTIDFETGLVTFNSFLSQNGTPDNGYYDTNVFTLNFPIPKPIIFPLRNRILAIDLNDPLSFQINMIAES